MPPVNINKEVFVDSDLRVSSGSREGFRSMSSIKTRAGTRVVNYSASTRYSKIFFEYSSITTRFSLLEYRVVAFLAALLE